MRNIKLNKLIKQVKNLKIAKNNNLTTLQFIERLIKKSEDKTLYYKLYSTLGHDAYIISAAHSAVIFNRLHKRYSLELNQKPKYNNEWITNPMPKIIWWLWLQGLDQAPELVKVCLKSLRKNFPDYDIKIVTNKNIKKYIDLPIEIYNKHNSGWISEAFYSDIIRLALLAKYGGIWMDSTVYCSNDNLMRNVIEKSNMFVYQNLLQTDRDIIKMSSWLIATKKNNPYISEVSKILNNYAMYSNYTEDYFVCHLLLSLFSKKYSSIWQNIPKYDNFNPHILRYLLNKPISVPELKTLLSRNSFHKLNNHIEIKKGDTVFSYLKNNE